MTRRASATTGSAASLGISGWNRLRLVDWPSLRRPLATGFAFAMALSLGDLGVIALFGSDAVQTLPYLLLARMGSYRTADAAGLALLLGLALPGADGWPPTGSGRERDMTHASWRRRRRRCGLRQTSSSAMAKRRLPSTSSSPPAAITAVMGPSGSGKSTLLNLVAGFETPQSRPRADRRRRRDGAAAIGTAGVDGVPGEQSLCPSRRRSECRARPLAGAPADARPTATRSPTALERTGLAGKEKRLPRELSGGERQRVALARALVRDRPVLLLDEPFASLGPALRDDMLDLVAGAAGGAAA